MFGKVIKMKAHDEDDILPGIGPHEGKELELMLAGKKPVAMFSDVIPASFDLPEEDFAPHVESGRLVKREVVITASKSGLYDMRYLFYVLPGEEWRIDRLIQIHRDFHQYNKPTSRKLEKEIGQLLGYQDQDIQVFLDRSFAPLS
jgi:hypothetical protein